MPSMQVSAAKLANRIEEMRHERGMIRSEVAGALRVNESTVWRWENGAAVPDAKKFALAELFEVPVSYLMGWTDERRAA